MASKASPKKTSKALGRLNIHGANVLRLREPASKWAEETESPALRREKSEGALCFRGGRRSRQSGGDDLRSPGAEQSVGKLDMLCWSSLGTKFAKERSPNKPEASFLQALKKAGGVKHASPVKQRAGAGGCQKGGKEEKLRSGLRTAGGDRVRFEPSGSQPPVEAARCATSPAKMESRGEGGGATMPDSPPAREPRYCPPTPLISRPTMFYRLEPLPTWPQNSPPAKTPLLKPIMPETFTRRELITRPVEDIPEPPQRTVPSLTHFSQHGIPDRPKTAVSPEQLAAMRMAASGSRPGTSLGFNSRPGTSLSADGVNSRPGTSMGLQNRPATAEVLMRALERWGLGEGEEEEGREGGLAAVAETEEGAEAGSGESVGEELMYLMVERMEKNGAEVLNVELERHPDKQASGG
ncbi:hypothetical protein KFL_000130280 [Klebsormidium nitens]|uniref:Uncharacterized protein n=1 Tax=Klebsormidium nitens TaxID=105231 RepID=A0A1Y1HPA9_KLENI|nr:hypothetical protein KFL_000130280 [Klebsormidium nitens]|eukprot:GAQ78446.1 hypothetical protein KFL_000130280 [Klebsormidium nitens]